MGNEPGDSARDDELDGAGELQRADAPHRRFQQLTTAQALLPDANREASDPSHVLGAACPAAIAQLEQLDDTVFEAIAGKAGALDELARLWPEVIAQLGPALVEESREQYLRHALRVWRDCVEGDQIRNPALATTAIGVICLLFNE